jgi:hypothetical protein
MLGRVRCLCLDRPALPDAIPIEMQIRSHSRGAPYHGVRKPVTPTKPRRLKLLPSTLSHQSSKLGKTMMPLLLLAC